MGLRILIADGGEVLRMCRTQFKIEGYEAAEASDCTTLFELIEGWQPDGVIVDVDMPTGEGWQCLERLMALETLPLVVITISPSDAERVRALGPAEVLVKPFGPITLLNAVERTIRAQRDHGVR